MSIAETLKIALDLILIIKRIESWLLAIELQSLLQLSDVQRRNAGIAIDVVTFSLYAFCAVDCKCIGPE